MANRNGQQAAPTEMSQERREAIACAIVHTVAYVDLFDYPMTAAEIHRYLHGVPASLPEVRQVLANGALVPHRLSSHSSQDENYFSLPGREETTGLRQRRAATSQRLWPAAIRYGQAIAALPFVKMAAITGSLAVNNTDRQADIDYLIVTENDRLWLARAFTILLVRLAARHGIQLCPNYFLAERALVFNERNLYTAREIVQMVPVAGLATYQRLRQANGWTAHFLPNATGLPDIARLPLNHNGAHDTPYPLPRRLGERLLRGRGARRLEQWEMRRKIRKFSAGRPAGHSEAAFSADWCKGHFHNHASRVLEAYQSSLHALEEA